VLPTVELDYQMALSTAEVGDESIDRNLAPKFQTIEASRAQMMPEC